LLTALSWSTTIGTVTADAMAKPLTRRERVRAQTIEEIKDIARRHLAAEGAAALSLRAVARDLGVVSSAVYRYFPSRDDLLTALIVDAYDESGAAVEAADATCERNDSAGRWRAIAIALRDWAVANPSSYALVYGSPVPGYHAPGDRTIGPATRTTLALVRILADAHRPGALDVAAIASMSPTVSSEMGDIGRRLGLELPADVAARGFTAWSFLIGAITLDLFGQLNNVIDDRAALFAHEVERIGQHVLGFTSTRAAVRRAGRA
jgi:AcrR family transcriptional regulator